MRTSDFDYDLPIELIAQKPIEPRDTSKLLVLDRNSGEHVHSQFEHIGEWLSPGDLLVVNRSRVIPARLSAQKVPSGGKVEILLLDRTSPRVWKAIVGGKGLNQGKRVQLKNGLGATVLEELAGAQRLIQFDIALGKALEDIGQTPLPPYIHQPLEDPERYQTVYAKEPGSAAAPTAGLHFTRKLLSQLQKGGIQIAEVTLHIGLDTFAPVQEDQPKKHHIHSEWCHLSNSSAKKINAAKEKGKRVVAVGTTSVRVLESAAIHAKRGEAVAPFEGRTELFILPGYAFQVVDAIITNFHLPRSSLLMLVSAFAGREQILACYGEAIEQKYRFYSFGDAMLIL